MGTAVLGSRDSRDTAVENQNVSFESLVEGNAIQVIWGQLGKFENWTVVDDNIE